MCGPASDRWRGQGAQTRDDTDKEREKKDLCVVHRRRDWPECALLSTDFIHAGELAREIAPRDLTKHHRGVHLTVTILSYKATIPAGRVFLAGRNRRDDRSLMATVSATTTTAPIAPPAQHSVHDKMSKG